MSADLRPPDQIRLPLTDRESAGRALASLLEGRGSGSDILVLALPRGGVPVAAPIAERLGAELDVMLVRKLGVPGHAELAAGAIASDGTRVLNRSVVDGLEISDAALEAIAVRETRELERRERTYRDDRPCCAGSSAGTDERHEMRQSSQLSLFAAVTSQAFAERVASNLGLPLAPLEERDFEDGEHKSRPLGSVRGHDVYVLESLVSDRLRQVNDKHVRLLFLIGALKDAGAARVTVVAPYLCYARKDRRTKSRDPVATRYVAALFEAVGTDRMVTLDVHNPAAYQNAFRIPAEHLEARALLVARLHGLSGDVALVSPDLGGLKRADAFRERWSGYGELPYRPPSWRSAAVAARSRARLSWAAWPAERCCWWTTW